MTYWEVPRLWPGETVVCIGGGPSLTREDVEAVRGRARVIAINNAYQLAPWADVLYACGLYAAGKSWWVYYPEAVQFAGLKVTMDPAMAAKGCHVVRRVPGDAQGVTGLSAERNTLHHGWNSGYAAVNLAVHLGAACIILLGYDAKPSTRYEYHWHADHPRQMIPNYWDWILAYETLPAALAEVGVTVINCSRATALTMFPCQPLAEALEAYATCHLRRSD